MMTDMAFRTKTTETSASARIYVTLLVSYFISGWLISGVRLGSNLSGRSGLYLHLT